MSSDKRAPWDARGHDGVSTGPDTWVSHAGLVRARTRAPQLNPHQPARRAAGSPRVESEAP
jgi:hypothetical protein